MYDSVEQNVGIIAACIPTITPLFRSKESAKKPARQPEVQRPLHRHLKKSTPSSFLARTAHESSETHLTEIGPKSSIQNGDIGLESLHGSSGNVEAGIVKTVEISHERTVDSVPDMWSTVSHPQDDGTNFGQA